MTLTTAEVDASRRFMETAERLPVLWKLSDSFVALVDMLESEDAAEEDIERELARAMGDIERKAEGVATVVRALESLSDYQAADAKRLAERAKRNKAHADRLKDYALGCMNRIGVSRLETGRFTLAIRQNPLSVNVVDDNVLPNTFKRSKLIIEADKTAIRQHFVNTGEVVPGTEMVRGRRLSIS